MLARIGLLICIIAALFISSDVAAFAIPSPPPSFVGSYESCPSATSCFISGATGSKGSIAYTGDGASSWRQLSLPSGTSGLRGVSCASATTCVAVGLDATIIRTTDGGSTWTKQSVAAYTGVPINVFAGVSCPSSGVCHAVGNDALGAGIIVGTRDGTTWSVEARPANAGALTGVSCPQVVTCFAGGFNFSGSDGAGAIYATRDGGTTWAFTSQYPKSPVPSGTFFSYSHVSCFSSTCMAIGRVGGPAPTQSLVSASIDGGVTWKNLSLPPGVTPEGVRCSAVSTCFIDGGNAMIRTVDRGATWQTQQLPSGTEDLSGLVCGAPTMCYGRGSQHLVQSIDNGANWVERTTP